MVCAARRRRHRFNGAALVRVRRGVLPAPVEFAFMKLQRGRTRESAESASSATCS